MKKILFLLTFSPFLLAFQCDPEPEPCGEYIEFEKPNLVTIENAQAIYSVGDVLWLTSAVDRNQINSNNGDLIDLFESNEKLSYYIDFRKSSAYNDYFNLYLNENTTIIEQGEAYSNFIILLKDDEKFKSKIGVKLLEPGTYSLNLYNVATYNPDRVGCNFTSYSMITDFSGIESNLFTFVVE